jgi:RNA polymerase sigma-54 factor
MAISTRLIMRQGQSLVMTPQLLQAIKLLQLSNLELVAFVEQELERNPLLERDDDGAPVVSEERPVSDKDSDGDLDAESFETAATEALEGDWASEAMVSDRESLEAQLGTEVENAFDADQPLTPSASATSSEDSGFSMTSAPSAGSSSSDEEAPNLENYVAAKVSLPDHLMSQLTMAVTDPVDRQIGEVLIDAIDEAGYMREDAAEIADRLGVPKARVERVLNVIQGFDPAGIGARDLAECLAIQLREAGRFDPAMQALIENLPLLAKRDFAQLKKLCRVDQEDLTDMLAEIRRLDPKPGRAFGGSDIQPVIPDVIVRPAVDGSWHVELNAECMPRVLVNQTYVATVSRAATNSTDKSYVAECLQNANWLTRSLEQRARTILKVAIEIVKQQDGFFAHGLEHLRPLNLKTVADAIGMHESTVSRVTSNKYLSCHRGLFEFKFFFTASIPAQSGGEAHSSEAVRFRIKQMIDQEAPNDVLSDDAIVLRLKEANINIARRTVAKYRESMKIASSVERRREKMANLQAAL